MFDGVGKKDSVWSMLFDNDWRQRANLDALEAQTDTLSQRMASVDASADARIAALERRVAELALVNRTLVDLLVASGVVTSDAFDARLRALDLEDGALDGR